MFVKINLSDNSLSSLGGLPAELKGLDKESLKDLSWTDPALGLHGYGFLPVKLDYAPLEVGEMHAEPEPPVLQGDEVVSYVPAIKAPASEVEAKSITRLQFIERLAHDELIAIYTAAKENVSVEVFMDKLKLAEEVNLDDSNLKSGLTALVEAGILTQDRVDEIVQLPAAG